MTHPANRNLRRRAALGQMLALGAGLALPSAQACEFFCTSLRVYRPWARETPVGDGVAVINVVFDEVSVTDRLIRVESPLAQGADMVRKGVAGPIDLLIPEGQELTVGEACEVSIRLTGLKQSLLLGREYPLRLWFEKAGELMADIDIAYTRDQAIH